MVSLDQLSPQDISLVSDHVIIFLLFCLLLLGLLDDFFKMADVVFLVFYDLLGRLDLGFGSVFVSLDFNIFSLHLLVLLIKFYQLLVLGLDLISKLLHLEGHSFIFFLEVRDFLFWPQEILWIQISIGSYSFIKILLMFTFVLYLLVLSLKVLNLGVFQSELLEDLVVFGMSMWGFNAVFFLLFLDLFQYLRQSLLLNLVAVTFILYLLILVHLFDILFVDIVLLILSYFTCFIDFHLFAIQCGYFALISIPLGKELLKFFVLYILHPEGSLLVSLKLLCLSF